MGSNTLIKVPRLVVFKNGFNKPRLTPKDDVS